MIQVLWDVTLCLWANSYFPMFRRKFCFHLHGKQYMRPYRPLVSLFKRETNGLIIQEINLSDNVYLSD
jgi:hypothetical protein